MSSSIFSLFQPICHFVLCKKKSIFFSYFKYLSHFYKNHVMIYFIREILCKRNSVTVWIWKEWLGQDLNQRLFGFTYGCSTNGAIYVVAPFCQYLFYRMICCYESSTQPQYHYFRWSHRTQFEDIDGRKRTLKKLVAEVL